MSDELFTFDDEPAASFQGPLRKPMTDSQRSIIRDAFGKLGLTTAPQQFAVVKEVTGVTLTSVADLDQAIAQTLIYRLESKVTNVTRRNTGNAWDDRDEDTWIDKL